MKPKEGMRFVRDGTLHFVRKVDEERGVVCDEQGICYPSEHIKFFRKDVGSSQLPKYLKPRAVVHEG